MSESSLYLLSQRLRLLARADIYLAEDGRVLRGAIRQQFEAAFRRTSALLDLVVDGNQLQPSDVAWLKRAQARTQALRGHVRELEQAFV